MPRMFHCARVCAVVAVTLALSTFVRAAEAQDAGNDSLDREARALFQAGSTAFEDARYDDALGYFRRAYELSHRPAMLYNVGLAADRLRHDEDALAAFQQFLTEAADSPRRHEVEVRVAAIQSAIAARPTTTHVEPPQPHGDASRPDETHPVPHEATTPPPTDREGGGSAAWIAGPVSLGAVGIAGVAAALVGIAGAGGCVDMAPTRCVEERATSWGAVGLYGGVGIAAIAGAVIWLVVGLSGDDDAPTVTTRNGATELSWRF